MKRLLEILTICLAGLLVWSCAGDMYDMPVGDGNSVRVIFRFDSTPTVKSSLVGPDDSAIESVCILAYRGGTLEKVVHCGPEGVSVALPRSLESFTYNFYAVANVGEVTDAPALESDLPSWRIQASSVNGYVPMAWNGTVSESKVRSVTVKAHLQRLAARVDFRLDGSLVDGLYVKSVTLKQAAADMAPFSDEPNRAGNVMDFDSASEEDLERLNSGGTVSFYALENMQGTLLPGNMDHWAKTPDSIGDKGGLCTYLEVMAKFRYGSKFYGSVKYRLFLGQDNTTNFDVKRNQVMGISLKLTEGAYDMDGIDWQVDTLGLYRDRTRRNVDMYLAQRKIMPVAGDIQDISLRKAKGGCFDDDSLIVSVYSNNEVEIASRKVGVDTVFVSLKDEEGEEFMTKLIVNTHTPHLNIHWENSKLEGETSDSLYVAMDGETKNLDAFYADDEGRKLSDFDEELYEELLHPSFDMSLLSSDYFGLDGDEDACSLWLKKLGGLEEFGEGSLNTSLGIGKAVVSAPCEDVPDLECVVWTCDPFPAGKYHGVFDSKGLVSGPYRKLDSYSDGHAQNETFRSPIGEIREYTGREEFYSFAYNGSAWYFFNGGYDDGNLVVTLVYESFGDRFIPSLSEAFHGVVRNSWSREQWASGRTQTIGFAVHVAIGGEVTYKGSDSSVASNYHVSARWAHLHYNISSLSSFARNIVSSNRIDANDGTRPCGLTSTLYKLSKSTGYPISLGHTWYKNHKPEFTFVDINEDNSEEQHPVELPYLLPWEGYKVFVHSYLEYFPNSNNWVQYGL